METNDKPNIKQAVPFFKVADMKASLRFYVDGLGFAMTNKWEPRGKVEWCWLQREGVALMLQEPHWDEHHQPPPMQGKPGEGVSICFMCGDALALYHEFISRGLVTSEPFVGNNMWVVSLRDPDGYVLEFESMTDVPEETRYSEWK
jgi:lactoylglutathione lyase